jgi:hypothetical protein
VDGERRVLQRADFLFRAVALSAGAHRVHFRYASFAFRLGLLVTAIAATAVLAILVFGGAPRRASLSSTASTLRPAPSIFG